MEMKKALFAGLTAFGLVMATSGVTYAGEVEGVDSQSITVGNFDVDVTGIDNEVKENGDVAVAISVNALQQVSTNTAASEGAIIENEAFEDGIDFGSNTFENQVLNVNNFQQGVNQAQQGAIAVAAATGNID